MRKFYFTGKWIFQAAQSKYIVKQTVLDLNVRLLIYYSTYSRYYFKIIIFNCKSYLSASKSYFRLHLSIVFVMYYFEMTAQYLIKNWRRTFAQLVMALEIWKICLFDLKMQKFHNKGDSCCFFLMTFHHTQRICFADCGILLFQFKFERST